MIRFLAALVGALTLIASLAQAAPASPSKPGPPKPSSSPPPKRSSSPAPRGAASQNPAPASFDLGVWTVHANSLDANFKTGDFSTPTKVVMTRAGGDVTADRANGNYKKQVLFLEGHVIMHDSQGSAASLSGGPPSGPSSPANPSSPSTLTADKAQIDGAAKIYKAIGNVHYVQADTVVTADNGTLDDAVHDLLLEGAVHIVSGTRNMSAQKVLYNTITGSAHAQGDVTMQFPSEFHRKLATPKPIKIPKNAFSQPLTPSTASP
jgi:lipopolysaccharide assembly outer membrane protein LptD (OstA)